MSSKLQNNSTKIAVPIMGKDYMEVLFDSKKAIESGADLLELRIDYLKNYEISKLIDTIKKIDYPMIGTNRDNKNKGYFKRSEEERINILKAIAPYVEYIDCEIETEKRYIDELLEISNKMIISYHNFTYTPSLNDLYKVIEKESEFSKLKKGSLNKVAVNPLNMNDTLKILKLLEKYPNTIAISMGELGAYTRAIAHKFNSPIVFASVDKKSAKGQISIEKMKYLQKNL